jgi:hypothetical protein
MLDERAVLERQRRRAALPNGGVRQTCKACGEPHKFCFQVPDEIWVAVVPAELQNRVVCLHCFDDFAYEKGIKYAAHLAELCFAGDAAAFVFKPEARAD